MKLRNPHWLPTTVVAITAFSIAAMVACDGADPASRDARSSAGREEARASDLGIRLCLFFVRLFVLVVCRTTCSSEQVVRSPAPCSACPRLSVRLFADLPSQPSTCIERAHERLPETIKLNSFVGFCPHIFRSSS